MEYQEILKKFCSTCSGKISGVFFEAYTIIDSLEKEVQSAAVQFLCENIFSIESDESHRIEKEYYTQEQLSKARKKLNLKFEPFLNDLIIECTTKSVPEQEFYEKIWGIIQSNAIFKSKRERALALFTLADNELIPYRSVGMGISMSNEEYNEIINKLEETVLDDTKYLIKLKYEQKTQRSSLIVDKLLSLDNSKEQAVFMAILISQIERNIKNRLKDALDEA